MKIENEHSTNTTTNMEEYFGLNELLHSTNLEMTKKLKDPRLHVGFLLSTFAQYEKAVEQGEIKEIYGQMRYTIECFYKLRQTEFVAYKDLIEVLATGMYKLDTQCGEGIPDLHWDQSREEHFRIIALLEQDRLKFKQYMIETLGEFDKFVNTFMVECYRYYFLVFASLLFKFNGYQAPFRLDPKKAVEDAMGITNLYTELLEELGIDPGYITTHLTSDDSSYVISRK